MTIYNTDDIQRMIKVCNADAKLKEAVLCDIHPHDVSAVRRVLELGCAEDFDHYDSDVAEQFINAFIRNRGEEQYIATFENE